MNKKRVLKVVSRILFGVIIIAVIVLMLIFTGVIKTNSIESIMLNENELSLKLKDSYQLTATILPSNVNYGRMEWSSDNDKVISVNKDTGYVTALKDGSANITVKTSNGGLATCYITTSKLDLAVDKIDIVNSEIKLTEGNKYTINYQITPSNATVRNLSYTSSDINVAIVDNKGIVTAIGNGKAIITVQVNNSDVKDSIIVNVYKKEESKEESTISLNKTNININIAGQIKLEAKITPTTINQEVTWTSKNNSIATVNSNGVVTGIREGTTEIIVTNIDGKTSICKVVVQTSVIKLNDINITEDNINMYSDESKKLTVTFNPSNATNQKIKWSSSDNNIATINDGVVKPVSEGTVVITATSEDGNYTDTVTIKITKRIVTVYPSSVSLNKTSVNINTGNTTNLVATVLPSNADDKTIKWLTSDASIATVDSNGMVHGIKIGTAIITAETVNGKKSSITVTVSAIKVTSISLNKSSASLNVGETVTIISTITPSNATNKTVTYTSSNTNIATVNSNGVVTAKNPGSVVITALCDDASNTVNITVNYIMVTVILLNQSSKQMRIGDTIDLIATVTPSNATNKKVVFTSNNSNVASVDSNGHVIAKAAGSTVITASCDSVTTSITINVISYANPIIPSSNVLEYVSDSLQYHVQKTSKYYLTYIWMKDPNNQIKKLESNTATYNAIIPDSEMGSRKYVRLDVGTMINKYVANGRINANKGLIAFNASAFYYPDDKDPNYQNKSNSWIVIHDGILTRADYTYYPESNDTYYILGINGYGNMKSYGYAVREAEKRALANNLINDGVRNTFSFGPVLLADGKYAGWDDPNVYAKRTAICQIDSNNYVMYIAYTNVNLIAIRNTFVSIGCQQAFNLDGGGSSQSFYKKPGSTTASKFYTAEGNGRNIVEGIYFVEQ